METAAAAGRAATGAGQPRRVWAARPGDEASMTYSISTTSFYPNPLQTCANVASCICPASVTPASFSGWLVTAASPQCEMHVVMRKPCLRHTRLPLARRTEGQGRISRGRSCSSWSGCGHKQASKCHSVLHGGCFDLSKNWWHGCVAREGEKIFLGECGKKFIVGSGSVGLWCAVGKTGAWWQGGCVC